MAKKSKRIRKVKGLPYLPIGDLMNNGRWKSEAEIAQVLQPKGPMLKTAIRRILEEITKGNEEPELAIILRKQIAKAKAGDTKAAEFLLNRGYGMPTQTVENLNPPIPAIQVHIVNPTKK